MKMVHSWHLSLQEAGFWDIQQIKAIEFLYLQIIEESKVGTLRDFRLYEKYVEGHKVGSMGQTRIM